MTVSCVVDARAEVGEGAVWSIDDGALWWVDITGCKLHRYHPDTDRSTSWAMPSMPGCIGLDDSGGIIVALETGFHRFDPRTEQLSVVKRHTLADGLRFNDGCMSPDGCFLATTLAKSPPMDPVHDIMILDGDGGVRVLDRGFRVGNGLAFSNDGRTLYAADTHPEANVVWRYDWDGDSGIATNRQIFFDASQLRGRPDGAVVDADGCYWFAAVGGWQLVRLTPKGEVDLRVELPIEKPTRPAFGGPNLATLYVTSIGINLAEGTAERQPQAGGVFAVQVGAVGVPAATFRPTH